MQTAMIPEGEDAVEKAALVGRTQTVHISSLRLVVATELGNTLHVQPMVADIGAAGVSRIGPTTAGTGWVPAIVNCIGRALNVHTEVGNGFGEGQPVGHVVEVKAAVAAAVDYDVPVHRRLFRYVV